MNDPEREYNILCPNCGNDVDVMVSATSWFRVTTDGSAEQEGDVEWDDGNMAYCSACNHSGEVKDFIKEEAGE